MMVINFLDDNKHKHVKSIKVYMSKIVIELNNINNKSIYEKVYLFVDYINNKDFQLIKQNLLFHFIKKIVSNSIEKKKLYKLMLEDDLEYNKLTPIKYINRLFRK